MGWKNVKEHYGIGYIVHITPKGLAIGSGYISDILVIDFEGNIIKRYDRSSSEDLSRYQAEMEADPNKLRELIQAPDEFTAAIPVYTYEGANILEKFCEELGYPNVTHDGELMYNNQHFAERAQAVERAKANARAGVTTFKQSIATLEEQMTKYRELLAMEEAALAKLNADYPDAIPGPAEPLA